MNEIFSKWYLNIASKGDKCINGVVEGGTGYFGFAHCTIHSDVRYGCNRCPENCFDFKEKDSEHLQSLCAQYIERNGKVFEEYLESI